jgi:hypothetical protein
VWTAYFLKGAAPFIFDQIAIEVMHAPQDFDMQPIFPSSVRSIPLEFHEHLLNINQRIWQN